jgi:Cof subfamily protein (haloacid dehalogenase superfamily)
VTDANLVLGRLNPDYFLGGEMALDVELAREAIDAIESRGFGLNCYVDDDLYVAEITPEARRYADFQHLPIHPVGDLLGWLEKPPTKLVTIDEPETLDRLRDDLRNQFDGRLYIAKSLPYFLEFASPDVTKGTGVAFVADRLGFSPDASVAFGDGENDIELLEWAGYGVAVANAHERVLTAADLVCPSVDEEGVAQVIEAFLDSRR